MLHPHLLQDCRSLAKLASCEAARRSCATRSTGRAMAFDQAIISSTSWRTWRGVEGEKSHWTIGESLAQVVGPILH